MLSFSFSKSLIKRTVQGFQSLTYVISIHRLTTELYKPLKLNIPRIVKHFHSNTFTHKS